jgi:cellulose synthase (UDP-forming)
VALLQAILAEFWASLDRPLVMAVAPALGAAALLYAILPWISPKTRSVRVLLSVASVALMIRYCWWRYAITLPPGSETLNAVVGWSFFSVEIAALFSSAISMLFLTGIRDRSVEADANADWADTRASRPRVDVLICSYNEERRILERTILGALELDYAPLRTWVLDDGRRPWLRELAEQLGCGYITRPDNRHAKAGNINHALAMLADLPEPPDFVAILDADFIPAARFVSRALGLFHDASVGVVQTPQHFVNPDPIQTNLDVVGSWPDEQRYFFDIVLPAKDAWGCSFCCGTSSLIRFEALRKLGGFPTDSVTEDYLLTLRLNEIGYRTVYLNEPLSFGLAPEGLKEYITQRGRWGLGFMQIVRGPSGPFSLRRRMGVMERLSLVETTLNWSFVYLYKLAGIVIPGLYLMFGIRSVQVSLADMLSIFLPYFLIHSLTMSWISRGRVMPIMTDVCQLLTAPAALKAVWLGLIRPHGQKFKVTAKGGDRGTRFVEWPLLRFFGALLFFSVASLLYAFIFSDRYLPIADGALALAWTWYNIAALVVLCCVCIEQPRRRQAGRFATATTAPIFANGKQGVFRMQDISLGGVAFAGKAPAALGERVVVRISDVALPATVVRVSEDSFGVRFENSLRARVALVRYIFSGAHERGISNVAFRPLAGAVLSRLLR